MARKNKNKQNNQNKQNNNNNGNNASSNGGRKRRSRNRAARMVALSAPAPQPTLGSIGGQLGTVAGNFLSKIFGLGAYKITKNSVFNEMASGQVPAMHSTSETIIMRHREYITDISSSTAFAQRTFNINPGLDTTFPFLSAVAQNFQEYEFRGLVFEYKSTSAVALNSTNTALGTVMMAMQYQSDRTNFVNKQELLNEMWSVDAKPAESFLLPVECDPKENPFKVQYVRTGSLAANQDQKMYDLGRLTVATVGSQAAAVVGELWATYEVALRKPRLSSGLELAGEGAVYGLLGAANATPLGTSRVTLSDAIGLSVTNSVVTFPVGAQGMYFITVVYANGTGVASTFNVPTVTNCSLVPWAGSNFFGSNGTSCTYSEISFIVNITDPTLSATVTFSTVGTIPTTPANARLLVVQIPYPLGISST